MTMKQRRARRACALLLTVLLHPALAEELPLITPTTGDNYDRSMQVVQHIMSRVYTRLGYSLRVLPLPLRRGLARANAGDYDGELFRVMAITQDFPDLLPVPTSLGTLEFYAYALQPIALQGWDSLSGYRLGGELGVKHIEYNTQGMQISFAPKPQQLFLMLRAGRIEVVILERNAAHMALSDLVARGERMPGLQLLGRIDKVALHTFLHRKHAALLPRVDQALRELDTQGALQRAWDAENVSLLPDGL